MYVIDVSTSALVRVPTSVDSGAKEAGTYISVVVLQILVYFGLFSSVLLLF